MRIVILGAGALGSIIGGHLAQAGEEVSLIARGERAAFLQKNGIQVTGLADFTVPVNVITDPRGVKEADFLLVTVKTYDTESALQSVQHLALNGALSFQNGVLKNEQLAGIFGWERVLGAAAVVSGEVMPNGAVRFTLNDRLALGEFPEGTSERAQGLAATMVRAGLRAEVSPHIQTVEWSKYVLFVAGMALAGLTRLATAKFVSDPDGGLLMARLMREVGQIATRLGISLEDTGLIPAKALCGGSLPQAVELVQRVGAVMSERAPAHKMSTLQDLERGRRLEVEETLGYAVRKGAELEIPLPTAETCYRLLAGVNRHLQVGKP